MTVFSLKLRNANGVNSTNNNRTSNFQKLKEEQEQKDYLQGFNNGESYSPADKDALIKDFLAYADAAGIKFGDNKTEETDKAKETDKTDKTEKTDDTKSTTASNGATSKEVEEIKEKKEKLQKEKEENMKKMDKLEAEIKQKAEDAEENIAKAAALQEQEVEEHKEETQQVLNEQINAYIEANKEGGEGMTREQLQENIKGAMPNAPAAADAIAALTAASEDVNEMDSYLASLNALIQDTNKIDNEIKSLDAAQEAAEQAAEEAAEQAKKQCCDPIGFTLGEGEDQVRYDFIKDDGNFDTTSDLLGAQNNWAEMEALDTDGDKVVSSEELEAGGIKAVKTDAAGNQSTVSFAEEFGKDFSIDLNSYKEGGSHSSIDTSTGEQEVMGTFDLNIGGESVNGYNTLDDVDFLQNNYGITNDIELNEAGEMAAAAEQTAVEYSEDLKPHVNFFETYTAKSEELKKEIADGYSQLGMTEEQIEGIDNATKKEANSKAEAFMKTLNAEEAEKNDDTDKAETTEEAAEEQPAVADETTTEDANSVVDEQTADAEDELEDLLDIEEQVAA